MPKSIFSPAEHAIKTAADAKTFAKMMGKTAYDWEKAWPLPDGYTLCNNMRQDSLSVMKRVRIAEQAAVRQQETAEHLIKTAADSKTSRKMLRKTANRREKARRASPLPYQVYNLPSFVANKHKTQQTPLPEGNIFYHNMLKDSCSDKNMKRTVDIAEQVAVHQQIITDRLIKTTAYAKTSAEMFRKIVNIREKARPLPEGNTIYHKMLQDSLRCMKHVADITDQQAVSHQMAAERAIRTAAEFKTVAQAAHKSMEERQKAREEVMSSLRTWRSKMHA